MMKRYYVDYPSRALRPVMKEFEHGGWVRYVDVQAAIDEATKPLHVEIERLKAENDSWRAHCLDRPVQKPPLGNPPAEMCGGIYQEDDDVLVAKQRRYIEAYVKENDRLEKALTAAKKVIEAYEHLLVCLDSSTTSTSGPPHNQKVQG